MKLNELSADERQYAINVINGIIRDKHDKGCANPCIDCERDSKGCRTGGSFEWKHSGIMEKLIEVLKADTIIGDKEG